jgi:hypothetical protein
MLEWTTMPGHSRSYSVGTRCAITRSLSALPQTRMSTAPSGLLANSCLLRHTSKHTMAAPAVGTRSTRTLFP